MYTTIPITLEKSAQMGIQGLLPLLKSVTKKVHLEAYAGQTVAIDAYSWLHKGIHACVADLYHQRPTAAFVEYCLSKVRLLQRFSIKPILVFDGGPLPMKKHREVERERHRTENRRKADECLKANAHVKALEFMGKCADVTPEMAFLLIEALRREGVEFVVAPYEADAQMAYLDRMGMVSAIISEDSDLLLFGCKRILYKLDKYGNAEEVCLDRLAGCEEIDLREFTLKKFRQMCIISGCDYLAPLGGVGLKTVHKYFLKYRTLDRVLFALRREANKNITSEYEQELLKAELTFQHQRVYCPKSKTMTTLLPFPQNGMFSFDLDCSSDFLQNLDFLGPVLPNEVAQGIAEGRLNPISLEPFVQVKEQSKENVVVAANRRTPVKLAPLLKHVDEDLPRLTLKRSFTSQIAQVQQGKTALLSQTIPRYAAVAKVSAPTKGRSKAKDKNQPTPQYSILNFCVPKPQ